MGLSLTALMHKRVNQEFSQYNNSIAIIYLNLKYISVFTIYPKVAMLLLSPAVLLYFAAYLY